jgi:hypothetical protein
LHSPAGYPSPYIYRKPKPETRHLKKPSADQCLYFNYGQIYDKPEKRPSLYRRSTTTRSSRKPTKPCTKSPPIATEDEAIRAGIPAGYSIKNWDPTELPIVLLGSVFDANSLTKWIGDWNFYRRGECTPKADVGDGLFELWKRLCANIYWLKRDAPTRSKNGSSKSTQTVRRDVISEAYYQSPPNEIDLLDIPMNYSDLWSRRKLAIWKASFGRSKEWRSCRFVKAIKKYITGKFFIRKDWPTKISWKHSPPVVPINMLRRDNCSRPRFRTRPRKAATSGFRYLVQDTVWSDYGNGTDSSGYVPNNSLSSLCYYLNKPH